MSQSFAHVAPLSITPLKTATPLILEDVADLIPPNPYSTTTNVSNLPVINLSPTTKKTTVLEFVQHPDLVQDLVPTQEHLTLTTTAELIIIITIITIVPLQLPINPDPTVKAEMFRTPVLLLAPPKTNPWMIPSILPNIKEKRKKLFEILLPIILLKASY